MIGREFEEPIRTFSKVIFRGVFGGYFGRKRYPLMLRSLGPPPIFWQDTTVTMTSWTLRRHHYYREHQKVKNQRETQNMYLRKKEKAEGKVKIRRENLKYRGKT